MTAPPAKPVLNYVSPSYGPADGGTIVTLGGTSLDGVTEVFFGEVNATGVTAAADGSRVLCIAPPGTADTNVHVTAMNNSEPLIAAGAYTYTENPPGR